MMDFNIVELILIGFVSVLGYMWRMQSVDAKKTAQDLQELQIEFAQARGRADANNRTLFGHIEELKEAVHRVEQYLMGGKRHD